MSVVRPSGTIPLGQILFEALGELRNWTLVVLGLLALLLGNAIFDERLIFAGIPFSPIIFAWFATLLFALPGNSEDLRFVAVFVSPCAVMILCSLWSLDPEYGLSKSVNMTVSTAIASLFLIQAIRRLGLVTTLRVLVYCLCGLLVLAVLYKIQHGFFDRQVPFFLNGPIVFGRLMAMGALAAMMCFKGKSRVALFLMFFIAVVWTASKGPLLGLVFAGSVAVWLRFGFVGRVLSACLIATLIFTLPFVLSSVQLPTEHRLYALVDLVIRGSEAFESGGQYSDRASVFTQTIDLILRAPFGVGLGGWESAVAGNLGLHYPHNLFLEIWSECGVFLGAIALVPFLAFFAVRWNHLSVLAFFFLLVQQVSGDLLDARFGLVFSLLTVWFIWHQPAPERFATVHD